METKTYDLLAEPAGGLYHGLLDFAASLCPLALLVIRPEMDLAEGGRRLLASLEPFVDSRMKSSSWPGTELLGDQAELVYFRLESGSSRFLKGAVQGLYGWQQPELPEDLCLLRADREPWLTTIAHESDASLQLTDWEKAQLLKALPQLRIAPSHPS
jgi:hypothetical protein